MYYKRDLQWSRYSLGFFRRLRNLFFFLFFVLHFINNTTYKRHIHLSLSFITWCIKIGQQYERFWGLFNISKYKPSFIIFYCLDAHSQHKSWWRICAYCIDFSNEFCFVNFIICISRTCLRISTHHDVLIWFFYLSV